MLHDEQLVELEAKIVNLIILLNFTEREIEQLGQEKQELENNLSILVQLAEAEITERDQRIDQAENQEQRAREQAGRLINDLAEERRNNSLLRVEKTILTEQIEEVRQNLNANQVQNNLLRNQQNILQTRYQQGQISINNLEGENNSKQTQIRQLQRQITNKEQGINRLRVQKNNYHDLNNQLNEEIDHLNQENATLQLERNEAEDLRAEINSLKGQNVYWQEQDDRLRQTVRNLQGEAASYLTELNELDSDFSEQEQLLVDKNTKLAEEIRKKNDLQEKLKTLQDQINNHVCPAGSTHTCSPCSLIHLPEPHSCPIVKKINCSHLDYEEIKKELEKLKTHSCENNSCSEIEHQEIKLTKEREIIQHLISELELKLEPASNLTQLTSKIKELIRIEPKIVETKGKNWLPEVKKWQKQWEISQQSLAKVEKERNLAQQWNTVGGISGGILLTLLLILLVKKIKRNK